VKRTRGGSGSAVLVPAGVWHNVVNAGDEDVKLYSLYAPPAHLDGTIHRTKADAEAAEEFERATH
jgi:mannose-6-phosphate isomerase-like protein (cupin superfamily)